MERTQMRAFLGMTLAMALAAPALAQAPAATPAAAAPAAPRQFRDARERAPAALIGLWKADLAASTFGGAKPKSALRSFAWTEDGKVLVTFMTVGANGAYTSGHWAAQVDGTDGIEYHSTAGSIPYNIVRLTKVDEKNLDLVVFRHSQTPDRYHYTLSDDGKTLTYTYPNNKIVYRKWEAMDW
jgi:hypothetical protein